MKELSLNVLDIAENSVKAGASLVGISLEEVGNTLTLTIEDNGCGMKPDILRGVIDPFYTTRTTRKVGLGIPLLKVAAEQTGGSVHIVSRHVSEDPNRHGTVVTAVFYKDHIDFTPLGDIISTITTLIQGSPQMDFVFEHKREAASVHLDTRELRQVLGNEVPLNVPEVLHWITEHLEEQYGNLL